MMQETVHMSSVAIDGRAVLIEGPSGAGKSDLALRLIDRGAALVSDDYTILSEEDGLLVARPPVSIAGLIEVRGVGILPIGHRAAAPVALLVRLGEQVERMPEPRERRIDGVAIAEIVLDGREPSAPIKVEMALKRTTS